MKNPLKKILDRLWGRTNTGWDDKDTSSFVKHKRGVPHFNAVNIQKTTPPNSSIQEKEFVQVIYKGKPMWALFHCPCGCGTVISLSLQDIHKPHWQVSQDKNERPTLFPSVWQKSGCKSHFCVFDGHIYWA